MSVHPLPEIVSIQVLVFHQHEITLFHLHYLAFILSGDRKEDLDQRFAMLVFSSCSARNMGANSSSYIIVFHITVSTQSLPSLVSDLSQSLYDVSACDTL